MDFKKIKKITDALMEWVSEEPAINELITKTLEARPAAEQSKFHDALDTLKLSGRPGLTGPQWLAAYQEMRNERSADDAAILQDVARTFYGQVLERVGDRYRWILDGTHDLDQDVRNGVEDQIDDTSELLARAKALGEFNLGALARVLMARGESSAIALFKVEHFVMTFPSLIEPIGGGRYRYVEDQPAPDALSTIRDAARRAADKGETDI